MATEIPITRVQINPQVRARMSEVIPKIEAQNVRLGHRMCAIFGKGDTRALLLTPGPDVALGEVRKSLADGGRQPDRIGTVTVATLAGFFAADIPHGPKAIEAFEYIEELTRARQEEQLQGIVAKLGTGLVVRTHNWHRLMIAPNQPINGVDPVDLVIPATPVRQEEYLVLRFEIGENEKRRLAVSSDTGLGRADLTDGGLWLTAYRSLTDGPEIANRVKKAREIAEEREAERVIRQQIENAATRSQIAAIDQIDQLLDQ